MGRLTASASRVIARYGKPATLKRPGQETGPAWNPTAGPDVEYSVTCTVSQFKSDEIDGTQIQSIDRKVFVSVKGLTIEPDTADRIVIDGNEYSIVEVGAVETLGEIHIFVLQVRK